MSDTVICRYCAGTGQVQVLACPEVVKGRPCRNPVAAMKDFWERQPEIAHLQGYCALHRSLRWRDLRAQVAPSAERSG